MNTVTFFMQHGGVIITQVDDAHTSENIGHRLCAGGFITCKDSFWGVDREIAINLSDVSCVMLTRENTHDSIDS